MCPLVNEGLSAFCANNHCYDFSKDGYLNLLLANQKKSKNPGDTKESVNARQEFLSMNFYYPLKKRLTDIIISNSISDAVIVDIGCGTGYYTQDVSENIKNIKVIGTDISKFAIHEAAKNNKKTLFCVCSSKNLPIREQSIDLIVSVFSPVFHDEFLRILKKDGLFIKVGPGDEHLKEIREILYKDTIKDFNEDNSCDHFGLLDTVEIKYNINLTKKQLITLIAMTPYAYVVSQDKMNDLFIEGIHNITVNFIINIYKKIDGCDDPQ
jgi:23S rRNA (guanine745-N1)-methyltransferase